MRPLGRVLRTHKLDERPTDGRKRTQAEVHLSGALAYPWTLTKSSVPTFRLLVVRKPVNGRVLGIIRRARFRKRDAERGMPLHLARSSRLSDTRVVLL